jgi:succinate dehydrogenase flavin-adding protein (antitoxin of CptAB toxin-antitoxin module)
MMSDALKKEIRFMGQFIDENIDNLNENELVSLKGLLIETDLDLLAYFQNEQPLPKHINQSLFNKVKENYSF